MHVYELHWIDSLDVFSLSNSCDSSAICQLVVVDTPCLPLCSIFLPFWSFPTVYSNEFCFAIWIPFLNSFRLDKPECKRCTKALQELENIDDEADQLEIGFVKIHDEALADEYNLGTLPALVYYRHQIPILYEGSYHQNP